MKDKTNLPYLKYRDRGFMYFPDYTFVPFTRSVHETVRSVVSITSLEENTIEVCDVPVLDNIHLTAICLLDSCVLY